MSISMTGMASGIDTGALVDSLVSVASIPQMQLENKVYLQRQEISALQSLNSKVAELATLAEELTGSDALQLFSTSASSDAVTATAAAGASAGSIDVVVDSVARAQTSVSAAMTEASTTTFTITNDAGEHTEITASSANLDDVVAAINDSGAGVRAMKVAAGTDEGGNQLYRLQVTAEETGAAHAFSLHEGTAAEVDAGTATDVFARPGAAHVTAASDAKVRLWAGTDAEQSVTSATNTFEELLPGVEVTVSKVSTEPVTVTVTQDTEAQTAKAKDLVDKLSSLFATIEKMTGVTVSADGATTSTGWLQGESLVRDLKNSVLRAATDSVNGGSTAQIGIEITRYGTVEFDANKFAEALASDPDLVTEVFGAITGRVQQTAENFSDRYEGRLTLSIQSRQTAADRIDDQILEWDVRLDLRRANLTRQFTFMETQLAAMQSTSSWLTSQLSSMNPAPKDS